MRRIYRDVEALYTQVHHDLAIIMQSEVRELTLFEAGQLYLMVDKDCRTIWKRIEFLKEKA